MEVEKIINNLLKSYQELGGINHLEGPNLPSRQSVSTIVNQFESLIFPGFRDEAGLDRINLKYVVGEKISTLAKNLIYEAEKSLRYMCKIQDTCGKVGSCREEAEEKIMRVLSLLPAIRRKVNLDVQAAFAGDPAAKSNEEIILSYPGMESIIIYRIAHELWIESIPLIPRMMSEYIHGKTGIDIHPGAVIGESFFIDHGTGVVIGETTIIGSRVKMYHGVTLGAQSVRKDLANKKRHPTIEDDVTIYPGATILGGDTVIGRGSVIGGNVWILNSIPPFHKVYYQAENLVLAQRTEETFDYQI